MAECSLGLCDLGLILVKGTFWGRWFKTGMFSELTTLKIMLAYSSIPPGLTGQVTHVVFIIKLVSKENNFVG